jgi:transposase-like protein
MTSTSDCFDSSGAPTKHFIHKNVRGYAECRISHCVWLYFRFCLRYRDIGELMAERGISLAYEAVRYWCRKFGQAYANALRRWRL